MKTSSSKPAISTSPDNHCSLYDIKYCLKMYQNVWLEYFVSFLKLYATVLIAAIFTKPQSFQSF